MNHPIKVDYMIPKQKVSLLLTLFCCMLLVGCTQNATPLWWQRTEIGYSILKEPLMRLMAVSIVWSWVFAIAILIQNESGIGGCFIGLFSPLILWFRIGVLSLILNIAFIPLVAYGITGTAYSFDFDFLFFCTLLISVSIPALILLFFFVGLLLSGNASHKLFGGSAIVVEAVGFIFLIRDVLKLFGD